MAFRFEQGVVREWALLQLGRGNQALTIPATRCSDKLTNGYFLPALWKDSEAMEGAKHIREYVAFKKTVGQDMEFGPLPGMPFWGPNAILGSVLPATFVGASGPVIGGMLNAYPHTFVRHQRSKFINLVDSTFHLGLSRPRNSVSDAASAHGDVETEQGPDSFGWHCVTYGEETGSKHSCWLFWKDSELFSAIIEHRRLNTDGSEADLANEWKPADIWNFIIKPRIDRNMPIKRFGVDNVEVSEGVWEPVFVQAGEITQTEFVTCTSYLFPLEPLWDRLTLATWTASDPAYGPNTYMRTRVFPGWELPHFALLIAIMLDSASEFYEILQTMQATYSTNCLLQLSAASDYLESLRLIAILQTMFEPIEPPIG